MDNIELIGYCATAFGSIQLVPEIAKALKTHHLRDLSWGMLVLMIAGSVLWVTYGTLSHTTPLIISASLNLTFSLTLTTLKLHYNKFERPVLSTAEETQTDT